MIMKQTSITQKYNISFERALEISVALSEIKLDESLCAKEMIEIIVEKLKITEENEVKAIEELVNEAILNQKRN